MIENFQNSKNFSIFLGHEAKQFVAERRRSFENRRFWFGQIFWVSESNLYSSSGDQMVPGA